MNDSMWDEFDTFLGGVGERYMELMDVFLLLTRIQWLYI